MNNRSLSKLYLCGEFLCRFGAQILINSRVNSGFPLRSFLNFSHKSEFRKRSNIPLSNQETGFTLVEFILVMVVLSVLSVLALPVIQTGLNAYAVQKDLREASSQGRLALERMARDIASLPSDKAILLASSSALHFTDNTNTAVGYEQVGTRLERNHLTLADGVQSLDFFYADNAGEATNILENIRYVRIRLIMIENNLDFTVERVVMLRNQGS